MSGGALPAGFFDDRVKDAQVNRKRKEDLILLAVVSMCEFSANADDCDHSSKNSCSFAFPLLPLPFHSHQMRNVDPNKAAEDEWSRFEKAIEQEEKASEVSVKSV